MDSRLHENQRMLMYSYPPHRIPEIPIRIENRGNHKSENRLTRQGGWVKQIPMHYILLDLKQRGVLLNNMLALGMGGRVGPVIVITHS